MTPLAQVKGISRDAQVDGATMDYLLQTGFSRIPVHAADRRGILLGVVLVKGLIKLRPEDATPVKELSLNPIICVSEEMFLFELLNIFQQGQSHIAAVYPKAARLSDRCTPPMDTEALGVVTLE